MGFRSLLGVMRTGFWIAGLASFIVTFVVFCLGFAYDRVGVFIYVDSRIDLEITVNETAATIELRISRRFISQPFFQTGEYAGGLIQIKTRFARQFIMLRVPTLVAAGLLAVFPLASIGKLMRRRPVGPTCAKCGYNLTGNTSGRCPECGELVNDRELEAVRRWNRSCWVRSRSRLARTILILACTGLIVCIAVEAAGIGSSLDSTPNRWDYQLLSMGAGLSRGQVIGYWGVDRLCRQPIEESSQSREFGLFNFASYYYNDMEGASLECGGFGLFGVLGLISGFQLAGRFRNRE